MDSEKWQGRRNKPPSLLRRGGFDLQPFSFLQLAWCITSDYLSGSRETSSVWNIARSTKPAKMKSRCFVRLEKLIEPIHLRTRSFFSVSRRRIIFSFIPRCVTLHETTATGTARRKYQQRAGARTFVLADLLSRQSARECRLLTATTRNSVLQLCTLWYCLWRREELVACLIIIIIVERQREKGRWGGRRESTPGHRSRLS